MGFKDLSSFEKKEKEANKCKDDCVSTEFSQEITPKTAKKDNDCTLENPDCTKS